MTLEEFKSYVEGTGEPIMSDTMLVIDEPLAKKLLAVVESIRAYGAGKQAGHDLFFLVHEALKELDK